MTSRRFLFVTNRGPVVTGMDGTFRSAGGGLASGLSGALADSDSRWLFPISAPAELAAFESGRYLELDPKLIPTPVDPTSYTVAYEQVSNQLLWFLFHGLFDLSMEPAFDHAFVRAFHAYRAVNQSIAVAVAAAAPGDVPILVNDYHLMLVPGMLRKMGVDASISFFLHTPFPYEHEFQLLPRWFKQELLTSLAAADLVCFHTERWRDNFLASSPSAVATAVAPLPVNREAIDRARREENVANRREALEKIFPGLPVITRVDRIEPSKNLLRGAMAVESLLESRPKLAGQFGVLFFAYPSRQSLPRYQRLERELVSLISGINERWQRGSWRPIHLQVSDDTARSLAAYQTFDTLLVNPVRDGLNLVVAEAALLCPKSAQIVLSTEAGIADHLRGSVNLVNPLDVVETGEALIGATGTDLDAVKDWVGANTWERWFSAIDPRGNRG